MLSSEVMNIVFKYFRLFCLLVAYLCMKMNSMIMDFAFKTIGTATASCMVLPKSNETT